MYGNKAERIFSNRNVTVVPEKEFKSFFHGMIRYGQTDLCTKRFIKVFCIIAKSLETT